MNLRSQIGALSGVGEKRSELYHKLGIFTLSDLIYSFPRRYTDFSNTVSIADAPAGEHSVIRAVVKKKMPAARIRKGLILYKIIASDDSGDITLTFYNNSYIYDRLLIDKEYLFNGRINGGSTRKEMNTPTVLPGDETALMRPVYHLTEGLTLNMFTANVQTALRLVGDDHPDPLPDELRRRFELCTLGYALHNIHFPESEHGLELARRRLGFDELLLLRLGMSMLRSKNRQSRGVTMEKYDIGEFFAALPFEPTGAQKRACTEILTDMCGSTPMNRLVQGDVGSGKTAVAAAACWFAAKNGSQSALMAPTEILAHQHYNTLSGFLEPLGISVGCLTGSMTPKQKKELKERAAAGEVDVLVGTHALISADTEFSDLALVITDEQHRFGVNQRKAFAEKGDLPHKLVMSATPIPRTLGLIIYGDLDISVLDELPKGRKPVSTYAVSGKKMRERALTFVKSKLDEGRQGYVVCPLVEDSDVSEAYAAGSYKEGLEKGMFADHRLGLLHGQLSAAEKDAVMLDFKEHRIDLLVCTTVVEVGVDVPNAAVIVIENADRFGLSQLHQLRGRVGRGGFESTCILITDNPTDETRERLKIISSTNDGFKISEEDLRLRGAGDFFGSRQHGLPPMKIADVLSDKSLLEQTQHAAKDLLSQSPDLGKFPPLKAQAEKMLSENAENGMN